MKSIFDNISFSTSKSITKAYSTSFSLATKMLHTSIRQDIYNIYGFVRLADEIVDSFQDYDKITLFNRLKKEIELALSEKISINPVLNAFQHTVHKYGIERHLIDSFMKSMELDLSKLNYNTEAEYKEYIYGSADVVGLMCLQVFVKGDDTKFNELKDFAMHLGSAFQKINFLRDLKEDYEELNRTYFPNTNLDALDENSKKLIVLDIESDLNKGYQGIIKLPVEAKFGVFMAYRYYKRLLKKINKVPAFEIKNTRVRVPNHKKLYILTRSYVKYQLNMVN